MRQINGLSWTEHGGLWGAGTGIVRYDFLGVRWVSIALLDGMIFDAIDVADSGRGWAIGTVIPEGGVGPSTNSMIVEIRDDCVSSELVVPDARLSDVVVGPDGDAWAVGNILGQATAEPMLLHHDGHSWSEYPMDTTVLSDSQRPVGLALAADGSVVVATGSGKVAELRNGSWQQVAPLELEHGEGVTGLAVAGSSIWLVGGRIDNQQHQFLAHFDGSTWHREVNREGPVLTAVAMTAAGEGWMVGYSGAQYYYRDGRLASLGETAPWNSATSALRAVVALRDGAAVAGGDAAQTVQLTRTDFDWLHPRRALRGIAADPNGGEPVVVGWRCEPVDCRVPQARFLPIVWRRRASGWTETDDLAGVGEGTLESVAFTTDGVGWAVGALDAPGSRSEAGLIVRWDGSRWRAEPSPVPAPLSRVVASGDKVWAIGTRERPEGPLSYVIRRCGDRWCRDRELPGVRLLDIATAGPNTVAIAGETHAESGVGSGVLEVFDGNEWQAQAVDVDSVIALDIADDGSGWAFAKFSGGARSALLKRDGSKWAVGQLLDGLQSDMTGIEVSSETDGWAVGTDGVVLRMQDGTWSVDRPSPRLVGFGVPAEFRAVAMIQPEGSDSTEVWAVGNWQTVLRRSSRPSSRPPPTTWTPVPVPVARVLIPWACRPQ